MVHEYTNDIVEVDLGFDHVRRPRRVCEMTLEVPGFPILKTKFQVMPIPEDKDVILGIIWLREQNPEIDRKTLLLSPRVTPSEGSLVLEQPKARPALIKASGRRAQQSQLNF